MRRLHSVRLLLALTAFCLSAPPGAHADPPVDWTPLDIGITNGSTEAAPEGVWSVTAGGADIWLQSDEFHFCFQPLSGDGSITARILTQTTTSDPWAKAGVMLRENDSPGSPHMMVVMTPGNGVDMQWRPQQDGGSLNTAANSYPRRLPLYLRVQRQGDRFTAFVSEDGASWTQIGLPQQIRMGREILAGVCLTSHNRNRLCNARFDRVAAGEEFVPMGPDTVQALVRDSASLILWDSVAKASGYHVYRRGPGETGFSRVTRSALKALSYTDSGLTNGNIYRYHVTAVIDGRESVPSQPVSVTPAPAIQNRFYSHAIGTTAIGSAVVEADGSITVRGSGWDIWERNDGFQYLAMPAEGDVVVTARVLASPTQSDPWAKAGVMIRESLADNSRHAMLVVTPRNGVAFQWRTVTGGTSDNVNGQTPRYPMYLRLVRRGDRLSPYFSMDGLVYETAGPTVELDLLNNEVWVGLAVTAHRDRSFSTARFDQLSVTAP
jgi:regulation of enolase protein 1 (concanavalin A-like superfamily)